MDTVSLDTNPPSINKDDRECQKMPTWCGLYAFSTLRQDGHCSICLDGFRCPKLLPCSHTFCVVCLKKYMKEEREKRSTRCPLCRTLLYLPPEGVDSLLENYFVTCADTLSSYSCSLCKFRGNVSTCSQCDFRICSQCSDLHKKQHLNSDGKEASELESDNFLSEDEMSVPHGQLMPADFIRVQTTAKLMSSFIVCESNIGNVNRICLCEDNKFWFLLSGRPEVILFDEHGEEIQMLNAGAGLSDVTLTGDGSLLLAVWNRYHNIILRLNKEGDVMSFAYCGNCKPCTIDSFPDGRIVVAGPCDDEGNSPGHWPATIQLYSSDGHFLKDIGDAMGANLLEKPHTVSVNPVFGFIHVTDTSKRSVFTLSESGELLGTYFGGSATEEPFSSFLGEHVHHLLCPTGLCCDSDGNIIVCDILTKTLHVLNPFGEFIGLILTNSEEGFGMSASVAVDKRGQIWLGDTENGHVRVYEVISYRNNFVNE